MPVRIQRKREKGWRLPPDSRCVTRPGRWGNPYPADIFGLDLSLKLFRNTAQGCWSPSDVPEALSAEAYRRHHEWLKRFQHHPLEEARVELRELNLACYCPLPAEGEPDRCHAAILLELANG